MGAIGLKRFVSGGGVCTGVFYDMERHGRKCAVFAYDTGVIEIATSYYGCPEGCDISRTKRGVCENHGDRVVRLVRKWSCRVVREEELRRIAFMVRCAQSELRYRGAVVDYAISNFDKARSIMEACVLSRPHSDMAEVWLKICAEVAANSVIKYYQETMA